MSSMFALASTGDEEHAQLTVNAERVAEMADEAGQAALLAVLRDWHSSTCPADPARVTPELKAGLHPAN